jgi:hypothetical protein
VRRNDHRDAADHDEIDLRRGETPEEPDRTEVIRARHARAPAAMISPISAASRSAAGGGE